MAVIKSYDLIRIQKDGAKVLIKNVGKNYNILIFNRDTGRLVTAMKGVALKDVINLGENYGWTIE